MSSSIVIGSNDFIEGVIDAITPVGSVLKGSYKKSFAYYSIKDRLPAILNKITDYVSKDRKQIISTCGASNEDIERYIEYINKLKNDIICNKRYDLLTVETPEAKKWNKWIEEQENKTYFNNIWLFTECYVYRRLREGCELSKSLQNFDPFEEQKIKSFNDSIEIMCIVAERLASMVLLSDKDKKKTDFITLLKICLWANKCDLSLSMGEQVKMKAKETGAKGAETHLEHVLDQYLAESDQLPVIDPFEMNVDFENELLVDDTPMIAKHVIAIAEAAKNTEKPGSDSPTQHMIDIVCDNSGYELFADLCLAHFLVSQKIAQKIRFHVKSIPWYVSDVTPKDFYFVIKSCINASYKREAPDVKTDEIRIISSEPLRLIGEQWQRYIDDGTFEIMYDDFWTSPHAYKDMKKYDSDLYRKLQDAMTVIFKGDLNYRKLLGDTNFSPELPFESALQGFHPAPLVALRTVKADLICGLPQNKFKQLDKIDKDWMRSGEYGVIQFCPKSEPLGGSDTGNTCS